MKKIIVLFLASLLMLFSLLAFADSPADDDGQIKLDQPIEFLYADVDNTKTRDPTDPLIVMEADDYKKLFGTVPLERMLRSQIHHHEFIVLDQDDLEKLDKNKDSIIDNRDGGLLYKIYFAQVGGTIKGSYIATTAKMVSFGKLKDILINIPNAGHAKAIHTKHDGDNEVDEAEFINHQDVNIRSSTKTTEDDMPWMGL